MSIRLYDQLWCKWNDNGKRNHINKTHIDQDVDIETNIENIGCIGKTLSLCNQQHLSKIWDSIYQKVKQHWSWVERNSCL